MANPMKRLVPAAIRGSMPRTRISPGSRRLPRMRPTAPPVMPMARPMAAARAGCRRRPRVPPAMASAMAPASGPPGALRPRRRALAAELDPLPEHEDPHHEDQQSLGSGAGVVTRRGRLPPKLGTPMIRTTRRSTLPSRMWRRAPKRELAVLTMMLVPAARVDGMPRNRSTGSLTVPRARPTKPPTMPTPKDMTVSSTACHSRASEGRPSSWRVMVRVTSGPCRRVTDVEDRVRRSDLPRASSDLPSDSSLPRLAWFRRWLSPDCCPSGPAFYLAPGRAGWQSRPAPQRTCKCKAIDAVPAHV